MWNGEYLCANDSEFLSIQLTKGKIYEVFNGKFRYDDGGWSNCYESFGDFKYKNPNMKYVFKEVNGKSKLEIAIEKEK